MSFVEFKTVAKRDFWNGLNKETVGLYIRTLEKQNKAIDDFDFDVERIFGIDRNRIDELKRIIEQELNYAKFYLNWFKKSKENDFDKWVFAENVKRYEWQKSCNMWTKTNGKIKAIIKLENNISSVRVSLEIENDNEFLTFYESGKEICYTNLRKKESIDKFIEELKQKAEEYFKQNQYPYYCSEQREIKTINSLLHIESEENV